MPVFVPSRRKFLVYRAASLSLKFSRSSSVTSHRKCEFSSSSLAIRSSPLRVRLRSSASLRHRCKVTTLTPSVRAISLCGFPCLAKAFACASFVATFTLECRLRLAIAVCPQPLRASRSQNNPVNRCFLDKRGHWAEYPPLAGEWALWEAVELFNSKTPPRSPRSGVSVLRYAEELLSLYFLHPSRDS